MHYESLRKLLTNNEGFNLLFEKKINILAIDSLNEEEVDIERRDLKNQFEAKALEVWVNEHRIVTTKVYRSFTNFNEYWEEDQIIVGDLLEFIPLKYKNNLYFIIVFDFEITDKIKEEVILMVNRVEKNSKFCRKYIIKNNLDIQRMPFFYGSKQKVENDFSYDNEFLELIKKNFGNDKSAIVKLIHSYFNEEIKKSLKDSKLFYSAIQKELKGE